MGQVHKLYLYWSAGLSTDEGRPHGTDTPRRQALSGRRRGRDAAASEPSGGPGAVDRLDDLEDASHRLEDHFLTAMLSTSQLTASYAETFDDSVERTLRPERADSGADSA